mgnify:CR=1 FL=1
MSKGHRSSPLRRDFASSNENLVEVAEMQRVNHTELKIADKRKNKVKSGAEVPDIYQTVATPSKSRSNVAGTGVKKALLLQ